MSVRARMSDWLDSAEFYSLMQTYRHAPLVPFEATAKAYEQVKHALLDRIDLTVELEGFGKGHD